MERESGMDEDHATHTQTHTFTRSVSSSSASASRISLRSPLFSTSRERVFSIFFFRGFPLSLARASPPVSGARYIPPLAWLLAFCRLLRPRAAHTRPLIGRACHSPRLTSEVSAPPVTVIMVCV